MTAPTSSPTGRRADVVAAAVRLVAARGASAAADVAALLCDALQCRAVTVRGPVAGELVARAGGTGAGGGAAERVVEVPLQAGGARRGVLSVVAAGPLTMDEADVVSVVADVLAVALAAAPDPFAAAARSVLDEEADRAETAATLLDQVGRALVTIRYAADQVGAGRASAADLDEPVRAALSALRQAHRDLRAHALESGLRAALTELRARGEGDRPDDGLPPVRVLIEAGDPRLDRLPPAVAVTLERVAAAAVRGATGWARVAAAVEGATVKLRVECAENAYDAGELVRWARRVSALGGTWHDRPDGVVVTLPALPPEGHHDDRPDL